MEKVLIVIPARYGSSRLPGKPLVKIKGIEMIKRVSDIADFVCRKNESCSYLVATDDERIVSFCESREIPVMMTSTNCKSGTERCYEAARKQDTNPGLIINLQGDNPTCPPWILQDRYMEKGEGGCPYRLGLVGMERIRSITGDEKGNPLFWHDGIGGSAGICLSFLETNHTRYP